MKRFVEKEKYYNVWVGGKRGGFNVNKFILGKLT